MNTLFKHIRLLAITLAATLACQSCEYKELEDISEAGRVKCTINFNWSKVDSIPKTMRVAFYPLDSETAAHMQQGYTYFDIKAENTTIRLQPGSYRVVAYNNDHEHVSITGVENPYDISATAADYNDMLTRALEPEIAVRLDSIYAQKTIYDYPDYMVNAVVEQFVLLPDEPEQSLTLYPDSMVNDILLVINGMQGLDRVNEIKGAIDGTMNKRFIGFDTLTDLPAVTVFDAEHDSESIYAAFYVFGLEKGRTRQKITLFFWMDDKKVLATFHISDENATFEQYGNKIVIQVTTDINIRNFIGGEGGGFNISLDDWDSHQEEVEVGF